MQPARYDFRPVTRGDSEFLAVILKSRDIFTRQIGRTPLPDGVVVTWTVKRSGQPDLVKSSAGAGGLTLDLAAAMVSWAMTPVESQSLSVSGNAYRVRITWPSGQVDTVLAGNIPAED